jgi:hypothetical protein
MNKKTMNLTSLMINETAKLNNQLNHDIDENVMKNFRVCFTNAKTYYCEFVLRDYVNYQNNLIIQINFNAKNNLLIKNICVNNNPIFNNTFADNKFALLHLFNSMKNFIFSSYKNYVETKINEIDEKLKITISNFELTNHIVKKYDNFQKIIEFNNDIFDLKNELVDLIISYENEIQSAA